MLRIGLLFLGAYTIGHGHFASVRPDVVDVPLRLFHGEVNAALDDVSDSLASLGLNVHPKLAERRMGRIVAALTM